MTMTQPNLCGANLKEGASPFNRILCLGYYDGPTSGLVRCAQFPNAYRFQLVAWDSDFENRIYSLAEIDLAVFDSVVQMLTRLEQPHWPFWIPRWQFGSSAEESHMSSQIDQALERSRAANLLIATDHLDRSILACRTLEAAARDHLPKEGASPDPENWEFWHDYIGLS